MSANIALPIMWIVKNKWARRCFLSLLLLVIIILCGYYVTRYHVQRQFRILISESQYKKVQDFLDHPVEFPKSWLSGEPYSKTILKANQIYAADVASVQMYLSDDLIKIDISELREGILNPESTPHEEWDELEHFVSKYSLLADSYINLISQPDYEMSVLGSDIPPLTVHNFAMFLCITEYFTLQSLHHAKHEEWKNALGSALVTIRASVRQPSSQLLYHVEAYSNIKRSSLLLSRLITICDDKEILLEVLNEMNQLSPKINLDLGDQCDLADLVGDLRILKKRGYPVDLPTEITGRDLIRTRYHLEQYCHSTAGSPENAREWITHNKKFRLHIGQVVNSLRLSYQIEKILKSTPCPFPGVSFFLEKSGRLNRLCTIAEGLGYSGLVEEIYCTSFMFTETRKEYPIREKTAKARYDLVLMQMAQKIESLETGNLNTSPSDLCEKYFNELLLDPFSQSPYLWNHESQCFYSVGPDEKDNQMEISYKEFNGTISEGDISVFPMKEAESSDSDLENPFMTPFFETTMENMKIRGNPN